MDPRGNKRGVYAQFTPPVERLAYATETAGELIFPGIYAEPARSVVGVLRGHRSVSEARRGLPDAVDEAGLLS